MQVRGLSIPGAWEIIPQVHADERGSFHEWFKADPLVGAVGHRFDLRQANCSVSHAGVVRGVHFADVPPGQAKYVTCFSGAVWDVVIDLRVGSPIYGRWEAVLLDDERRAAVYLAEGLGHAFMSLADNSVVTYLCSQPYAPGREHAVSAVDPALGIDWPSTDRAGRVIRPVLSARDADAPTLASAEQAGLLPTWAACEEYVRALPQG